MTSDREAGIRGSGDGVQVGKYAGMPVSSEAAQGLGDRRWEMGDRDVGVWDLEFSAKCKSQSASLPAGRQDHSLNLKTFVSAL